MLECECMLTSLPEGPLVSATSRTEKTTLTIDANEAVASVAHRINEVIAIYPITPSSAMGEWADQWSAEGKPNIWGTTPLVVEMQSEGGEAVIETSQTRRGDALWNLSRARGRRNQCWIKQRLICQPRTSDFNSAIRWLSPRIRSGGAWII